MERHPLQSKATSADVSASTAAAALAALPLSGVIGAELAQSVAQMEAVLVDVRLNRAISRQQLAMLDMALDQAKRIAVQSQQISRLAGGRLRQSHERLGLHTLMLDVLHGRRHTLQQGGRQVRHHLKPVDVIVDPGLLYGLMEVAVDWAAEQGHVLQIKLDIKNWPEHGVLSLKASDHVSTGGGEPRDPATADTLSWHLLLQTAQAMGVGVERVLAPDHVIAMLEFPRTVRQLEGLTAVEVDAGGEGSVFLSESKPLAGHRLLLISADGRIRRDMEDICEGMGLVLDSTPTAQQAVRFCELDMPHIIVIDERLKDRYFDELRQDLARADVNFPFIEIAMQPNLLELSNWLGGSMSRISRESIKGQLPSILVMELAKVA